MDTSAETAANLARLNGLIQIDMACKRPLPPLKDVALGCAAFSALGKGMAPLHPVTHQLQMISVARQIGVAPR